MIYQWISGRLRDLDQLQWIPILLVRISIGLLFLESGRGKLFVKFEEFTDFFVQLGTPAPHFNALFVATTEFVGRICLIVGVGTRLFFAPLACITLFAIVIPEIKKVSTLGDFLYLPEASLLAIFVCLVFSGPGKISVDTMIPRWFGFEDQKV